MQVLVDLSCGSGLFTRRFVGSSQFEGVIAADYSETMLQQTRQLFNEQPSLDSRSVFVVLNLCVRLLVEPPLPLPPLSRQADSCILLPACLLFAMRTFCNMKAGVECPSFSQDFELKCMSFVVQEAGTCPS